MEKTAALAYYTIRSKQEYIYRTNKIKEIFGASQIIANAFSYLKKAAVPNGKGIFSDMKDPFALEKVDFSEYDGYVLWEGGGNICLLFRDGETCKAYNRVFSKKLLEETYSLTPLCCFISVDLSKDGYKNDYSALMKKADEIKRTDVPLTPCNALPFAMMNRNTWQPICKRITEIEKKGEETITRQTELTAEALHKREAFKRFAVADKDTVKGLDKLVTEKGKESLLAVVYADGNNMGLKIQKLLKNVDGYDECIALLRENSQKINEHYVTRGLEAIKEKLGEMAQKASEKDKNIKFAWRPIVGGGDEITFICNAHCALDLARAYLEEVSDAKNSACAGIAVFHSHYPFADAYSIAEQACENAKKAAKAYCDRENMSAEISLVDFQFIHSTAGTDLEKLREEQNGDKLGRPYCVKAFTPTDEDISEKIDEAPQTEKLYKLKGEFTARTSIKELGSAISGGSEKARLSFDRIVSQDNEKKKRVTNKRSAIEAIEPDYEKLFKLLYDLSEFNDVWFGNSWNSEPEKEAE